MWSKLTSQTLKTSSNFVEDLDSFLEERYSDIKSVQRSLLGQVLLGKRKDNETYEIIKRCSEDDFNIMQDKILEDIEMEIEILEKFCKLKYPYFVEFKRSIHNLQNLCSIFEY